MDVKFFKPKNKLLQSCMEGYYFLEKRKDEPVIEYLTFPNNFSIISILQNSQMIYEDNAAIIKDDPEGGFISDLICHYKKPIKIVYEGQVSEVTFYFKPLGLNAFIAENLKTYTNNFFSSFVPFDDYEGVMKTVLNEKDIEIKRDIIEKYWLSKYTGFSHPFLNDIVRDFTIVGEENNLQGLASKYHTSRQNINKLFDAHLGKAPSEFRKVQRFREALMQGVHTKSKNGSLTMLSYDSFFYDQSHLIKDFKALTGLTPKAFFKNTSFSENAVINWLFL